MRSKHPYFEGAFLDALRASPRRPLLEMTNLEAPSLRRAHGHSMSAIRVLAMTATEVDTLP